MPLVLTLLLLVIVAAVAFGGVARALGVGGQQQRAADLGALAGARAMHGLYDRLFLAPLPDGRPNPRRLSRAAYLDAGRRAALETARRNGAQTVAVTFPGDEPAPVRIAVRVRDRITVHGVAVGPQERAAEAELAPAPTALAPLLSGAAGEYPGPFAVRQGKPMRPDVAQAFDRMAAAAAGDGVTLLVSSAFRSDAQQAVLFAAHPDPKWVARPGTSLHRLGTELDLGPAAAYGWLAANARRFGFLQRYSWEPWHYGYINNPGTASVGWRLADGDGDGDSGSALPGFVPTRFAPAIARAAQRWRVGSGLLAAQLKQESGFDPDARSPAGALGIAQFMPGTARSYGLTDPFDPDAAIDAQAHLMHDLLEQFGSVPLALAAYNAGPAPVRGCGCVPAIPETVAYVAAILGLLRGAGDELGTTATLEVRLVR